MKRTVIIVAGGKGLRMGSELPKQFLPLAGKPVLMHTLKAFYDWDSSAQLLVVLPPEHREYWLTLCREKGCCIPHQTVDGGSARFYSVQNALPYIPIDGLTAVHDGVRPLISHEVIEACFEQADTYGAAIPVIPVVESVRELYGDRSRPFDRNRLCIVQTPQVFRSRLLIDAYQQPFNDTFTDDASVVEAAGTDVKLVKGSLSNIKITTPNDLLVAEKILESYYYTRKS